MQSQVKRNFVPNDDWQSQAKLEPDSAKPAPAKPVVPALIRELREAKRGVIERKIKRYSPNLDIEKFRAALKWERDHPRLPADYQSGGAEPYPGANAAMELDERFSNSLVLLDTLIEFAHPDEETILAAILYPNLRPPRGRGVDLARLDDIEHMLGRERQLGKRVRDLIERTLLFRSLNISNDATPEDLRLFRLMALWAAQDPRAILIRAAQLAVNLNNEVRKPGKTPAGTLKRMLFNAEHVYGPLAYIAGFGAMRTELMDRWLQITNPSAYKKAEQTIADFITPKEGERLRQKIVDHVAGQFGWMPKFHFDVEFRRKSVSSAYFKAERKGVEVQELFDIVAARVVLKQPVIEGWIRSHAALTGSVARNALLKKLGETCLEVFGRINAKFEQVTPEEFNNYVENPKPSGYSAVQSAFRDKRKIFELQVVDWVRHWYNTYGPNASHINYKTDMTEHSAELSLWREAANATVSGRPYDGKLCVFVFGPDNKPYNISDNPTVGGMLATIGSDAREVHIEHNYTYYPAWQTFGPSTPLANGCKVIPVAPIYG